MAGTAKQARNGVPADGATQNSAQPGPPVDVAGLMSASQAAAGRTQSEVKAFFALPAGGGVNGHEMGGQYSMFEWDSGLAVTEQAGEP